MPVGVTVTLTIRAQDVVHSWWIPQLGGKFDAIPKHTNYTWFKIPADKAGSVFRGQCAELCGRNHANMIAGGAARSRPRSSRRGSSGKRPADRAVRRRRARSSAAEIDAGQEPVTRTDRRPPTSRAA